MPRLVDRFNSLQISASSPDARIHAELTGREQLKVTFSGWAYHDYRDESALAAQLTPRDASSSPTGARFAAVRPIPPLRMSVSTVTSAS